MHLRIEPPTQHWPIPTARRPIWTGHQATLFHPGILAKYHAAAAAARVAGLAGASLQSVGQHPADGGGAGGGGGVGVAQVLVDQDVYDPLRLRVPTREGDRLGVQTVSLDGGKPTGSTAAVEGVPVGMRPPVATTRIAAGLKAWPGHAAFRPDSARWLEAFDQARREADTLAQQMEGVIARLLPGGAMSDHPGPAVYGGGVPASTLLQREQPLLDRLLHDAARCVRHYNAAVAQHPAAGMSRLSVQPDRVEVPLWALRWMKPRRRVYVDLADHQPLFITEDGEPLGPGVTLAPRALLMTAILRRPDRCALFIHGTGGWAYDRITEDWWRAWHADQPPTAATEKRDPAPAHRVIGAPGPRRTAADRPADAGKLAPMAVVTADLQLSFDQVPVNGRERLRDAVWFRHHLPHNLDRVLDLDPGDPRVRAKRELLATMDQDRDKPRRRAAFTLLHRLNEELAQRHPDALADAERSVAAARAGLANARIAGRRDWSCLLYPPASLAELWDAVTHEPTPGGARS